MWYSQFCQRFHLWDVGRWKNWSPSGKLCQSLTRRACIILSHYPSCLSFCHTVKAHWPALCTFLPYWNLWSESVTLHFVYLKSFLENNTFNYGSTCQLISQLARCSVQANCTHTGCANPLAREDRAAEQSLDTVSVGQWRAQHGKDRFYNDSVQIDSSDLIKL